MKEPESILVYPERTALVAACRKVITQEQNQIGADRRVFVEIIMADKSGMARASVDDLHFL